MFLDYTVVFVLMWLMIRGKWEALYGVVLCVLLFGFIVLRCPYIYGGVGFGLCLVVVVLPLFLSLFLCRLSVILAGFVPAGTPMWMAPFVSLAELISYVVRPMVLLIRPFMNLTVGALGGLALSGLCLSWSGWFMIFLVLLFFYEVFVALVHWFIVREILEFSKDH